MPYRDGDPVETFEDVRVIDRRSAEKQEKSVLCRFKDGSERFVSRQQCPTDQWFPADDSELFQLEVSQWLVDRWAEEPAAAVVKLPEAVGLRESAKALFVRLASGEEVWVPKRGIAKDSPVIGDGDRGELWVQPWLAKAKGWSDEDSRSAAHAAEDDRRANVGDDARSGGLWDADDGDIPF